MDLTKAMVDDVKVLNQIKPGKMSNITLIGEKGFISKEIKIDLFKS